jgi:hypothetical protein
LSKKPYILKPGFCPWIFVAIFKSK